jgi:hypothetical protein
MEVEKVDLRYSETGKSEKGKRWENLIKIKNR